MADEESTRPPLKVTFEQSGGFAGLVKGCVLSADELPADVAAELHRLVASSGLDVSREDLSRGARDRRQIAITIDRGGERVAIVCDDGCTPEGARPLVAFLAARARPQRP
jgi:hypothetical protein